MEEMGRNGEWYFFAGRSGSLGEVARRGLSRGDIHLSRNSEQHIFMPHIFLPQMLCVGHRKKILLLESGITSFEELLGEADGGVSVPAVVLTRLA